ncbi:hypothetical protein L580_3309 [Serratia fonticola AU-P3(3)]|nr:hypothetical protein L580_3309 [Serratia fonticola AU-P3(3)]
MDMPLDKKDVERSNRVASKTKFAVLRTDRSILLIALFVLALINVYTVIRANNAVESSKRTHEVVWVKMYPDGTTAIDEFKPENEQPVFVRTVNAGLAKYVAARFQVHPETIKRDYAEAGVFLGDTLFTQFTDKSGFDAADRAAKVVANATAEPRISVSNVQLDHYDQIEGDFSGRAKPVIRTTITWDETTHNGEGQNSNVPARRMIRITWTLLSRDEVSEKSVGWLRINPLGIAILSQEELNNR